MINASSVFATLSIIGDVEKSMMGFIPGSRRKKQPRLLEWWWCSIGLLYVLTFRDPPRLSTPVASVEKKWITVNVCFDKFCPVLLETDIWIEICLKSATLSGVLNTWSVNKHMKTGCPCLATTYGRNSPVGSQMQGMENARIARKNSSKTYLRLRHAIADCCSYPLHAIGDEWHRHEWSKRLPKSSQKCRILLICCQGWGTLYTGSKESLLSQSWVRFSTSQVDGWSRRSWPQTQAELFCTFSSCLLQLLELATTTQSPGLLFFVQEQNTVGGIARNKLWTTVKLKRKFSENKAK